MESLIHRSIPSALILLLVVALTTQAPARLLAGPENGRPSLGRVGGGGGRPGGNLGISRPSTPPNVPRPSTRPSMGNVGQVQRPNRPSAGGFNPSGGNRPNLQRPSQPGGGNLGSNRPNIRPPQNVGPVTRPGNIGGGNNRPNLGSIQRPNPLPGNVNRPGGGDRPNLGGNLGNVQRPTPLPGGNNGRPGLGGNRPGLGGADRPNFGNIERPVTLPGVIDRPGLGGNRPGGGDRPGIGGIRPPGEGGRPGIGGNRPGDGGRPGLGGDRPGIGGIRPPGEGGRPGLGGDRPGIIDRPNRPEIGDRPIIGGNRPNINRPVINRPGNNGNINIGNEINIGGGNIVGNRPSWDRRPWNNPGWGWGHNHGWTGNWHHHCINNHYGWYNGCWSGGYWGSNWYAPFAWGAVGWGLGSMVNGWGYGVNYYNPYYVAPTTTFVPYDYSKPIVVNNYIASTEEASPSSANAIPEPPPSDPGIETFDQGLALFKQGDYKGALKQMDLALSKQPGDPVIHEVRALTLFALGDYQASAAALNSFLSSAPGMDWTTLSGLYGNVDDYEAQLRKLEDYIRANPNDPAANFVLAYHYLVIGAKNDAINALKVVVKNQPKDYTAKRMLDALLPPEPAKIARETTSAEKEDQPKVDLVGKWEAKAPDTVITLTITENFEFTWKAEPKGQPAVEVKGELDTSGDVLSFNSKEQGPMTGAATPISTDRWQFNLSGSPPSDPGLTFDRIK